MRITKITLNNFGPHKNLEVSIPKTASVVGLVAHNGAGKTRFLNAVAFALTGVLPMKKEDYITWGEKNGFVELEFLHQGKQGKIVRHLGTSARFFSYDGKQCKKSVDLDAALEAVIGVTKNAMLYAGFIQQGDLKNVIEYTDATRRETLTKLMDLNKYKKLYKDAKAAIKDLSKATDATVTLTQWISANEEFENLKRDIAVATTAFSGIPNYSSLINWLKQVQDNEGTIIEKRIRYSECTGQEEKEAVIESKWISVAETLKTASVEKERCQENLSSIKNKLDRLFTAEKLKAELHARIEEENNILKSQSVLPDAATLKKTINEQTALLEDLTAYMTAKEAKEACMENMEVLKVKVIAASSNIVDKDALEVLLRESIETENRKQKIDGEIKALEEVTPENDEVCTGNLLTCKKCGLQVIPKSMLSDEYLGQQKDELKKLTETSETLYMLLKNMRLKQEKAAKDLEQNQQALAKEIGKLNGIEHTINKTKRDLFDKKDLTLLKPQTQAAIREANDQLEKIVALNSSMSAIKQIQVSLKNSIKGLNLDQITEGKETLAAEELKLKTTLSRLEAKIEKYEEKLKQLQPLYDSWQQAKGAAKSLKVQLEELEATQQQLLQQTDLKSVLPDLIREATLHEIYEFVLKQENVRQMKLGEIASLNRLMSEKNVQISRLSFQVEKAKAAVTALESCENIANVFSNEELFDRFLKRKFYGMIPFVNRILKDMEVKFLVKEDPEKDFAFLVQENNDTSWKPMHFLSGGQRVRLAFAYLQAIHCVVCPQIGLQCLDEPSCHLDVLGVESLRDTFISWGVREKNSENQLWIVDHNKIIYPAFEHSIHL